MTIDKPDGATPMELNLCPGCGAVLSKDSENSSDSFCGNVNCPFSGIGIDDAQWGEAYCWKLLASERAEAEKRIAAYRKVVGGLLHQMKIINGDNEKCVLPEYCLNHLLINEAERLMKEETK